MKTTAKATRSDKNRDFSVDFVRASAILMVILCHAIEYCLPFDFSHATTPLPFSDQAQAFMAVGRTIGRIGVPLFFMISGYFLLDRHYNTSYDVKRFYRNSLIPLWETWTLWVGIYELALWFVDGRFPSFQNSIREVLLYQKLPVNIGWYMPVLLCIYALIPFVARAIRELDKRVVLFISAIIFAYVLVPAGDAVMRRAEITEGLGISGMPGLGDISCFILYLLLGWLVRTCERKSEPQPHRLALPLIFIVVLALTSLIQLVSFKTAHPYALWYNFPTMPFLSLTAFIGLRRIGKWLQGWSDNQGKRARSLLSNLAQCSLGMFFVHPIVLMLTRQALSSVGKWKVSSFGVVPLLLWATAISWLVIRLVEKISIPAANLLFRSVGHKAKSTCNALLDHR